MAARIDLMKDSQADLIDAYIEGCSAETQPILRNIRKLIRKAAPEAEEVISYKMPAFRQHGILLYFAAFKSHIGVFPPVVGDPALEEELRRYRGPKGNLKFPLNEPIPYELIARVAALRVAQDASKATGKSRPKTRAAIAVRAAR